MKKYFIKEMGYVCEPSTISIKMIYDNTEGKVNVNFYNGEVISFFASQTMHMTKKREDFDVMLKFVLITLFEMYDRNSFQEEILDGNIQGLNIYDDLQRVRNKLGTVIWYRS